MITMTDILRDMRSFDGPTDYVTATADYLADCAHARHRAMGTHAPKDIEDDVRTCGRELMPVGALEAIDTDRMPRAIGSLRNLRVHIACASMDRWAVQREARRLASLGCAIGA